jgi:hypothetical protein
MLNRRAQIAALTLALTLQGVLIADPQPKFVPDKPTAREILDRMAETYANCKSYRDKGVTKPTSEPTPSDSARAARFSTAFVRPDRFRFEYVDEGSEYSPPTRFECRNEGREYFPYILWQQRDEVKLWRGSTQIIESLPRAAISGSPSQFFEDHLILNLLLPKAMNEAWMDEYGRKSYSICDMSDPRRIVDGDQGGVHCYRIRNGEESSRTYWIDQKAYLLRRIDVERPSIPNDSEKKPRVVMGSITYDPVINEDIPEADLQFNAPKHEQKYVFCTDNVLKVSVLKSGKIFVDGNEVSLDALDKKLGEFKKNGGRAVWFYSEAQKHREQPMERWQAQSLVCEKHRIPITGFVKPDFSDHPEIKRMTQRELEEFDRMSREEPEKLYREDDGESEP